MTQQPEEQLVMSGGNTTEDEDAEQFEDHPVPRLKKNKRVKAFPLKPSKKPRRTARPAVEPDPVAVLEKDQEARAMNDQNKKMKKALFNTLINYTEANPGRVQLSITI